MCGIAVREVPADVATLRTRTFDSVRSVARDDRPALADHGGFLQRAQRRPSRRRAARRPDPTSIFPDARFLRADEAAGAAARPPSSSASAPCRRKTGAPIRRRAARSLRAGCSARANSNGCIAVLSAANLRLTGGGAPQQGNPRPRHVASRAAEPVVALVFPVAAGILVGDEDRGDVLRVLEAELGRHAQLHREAVLRRQDLVGEA